MTKAPKAETVRRTIGETVLDGLPVTVEAVLGKAQVTVSELTRLAPGDNIKLESKLGEAVELRLNGVVIATGELVAVGENFGIRVQQIAAE